MLFLKDHVSHGHMTGNLVPSQSLLKSDCNGGAEEFVLVDNSQPLVESQLEEDVNDVSMHMDPMPSSSDVSLVLTVEPGPAPAPVTPGRSTLSSSPAPDSSARKRKLDDPVEQEILHFIREKRAKSATVASAKDKQGLAVFGHLLPFYQQLPPMKQMQFLHHISGYLMDLYAESPLQ
ncbi:hypothetical protein PoB_007154900 [Plakobranchus ocellatus]|uniref:BESS domain-containing protein n=1 Tax=Plakobranchus ocellatus TaxID=259542 RepID=A0AAV4DM18_9GAST|nr:hypothetical protein PoB_007154900 [Plakobranchus ocellatus]